MTRTLTSLLPGLLAGWLGLDRVRVERRGGLANALRRAVVAQ